MSASRPSSDVHICNLALDYLNQNPITSIDTPTTKAEETCARWYHTSRASTLRKHPWNFAIKRAEISEAVIDIPFGYSSAYALPSDFIRLLTIGDDVLGTITNEFDDLLIRYIFDITDVSKFDALFVEILALELSIKIGNKFTASEARVEELRDMLKKLAPQGYSVDGQERPPTRKQVSKWASARRNRSRSGVGSKYVTFDNGVVSPVPFQLEGGYVLISVL